MSNFTTYSMGLIPRKFIDYHYWKVYTSALSNKTLLMDFFKNPYWGTPVETHKKVQEFYRTDLMKPEPVPGALEGLRRLQEMGFRLVLITARHVAEEERTKAWLDQYYPSKCVPF